MSKAMKEQIESGNTTLGIELGSTRIKAVLINETNQPIASGSFEWENQLVDGIWTYDQELIWKGLQYAYASVKAEVLEKYSIQLNRIGAIGLSAMMHGYLPFDKNGKLLVPFRTWRNSMTQVAEEKLTEAFHYNIPQRWSIAHLYQAILNKEEHVKDIAFLTTLSGYIHWQLTGEKVIGIGDASGMFPIDPETKDYDKHKLTVFAELTKENDFSWNLKDILPKALVAGEHAGRLTEFGANLLDPKGELESGVPLCPPEGDAGTGMVATNSVAERTGNVSVGTSAFAMIVLENELKNVHPEIDIVTTPTGSLVGMVHTNNCSSDINAWVRLFSEFADLTGLEISKDKLYEVLFNEALTGDTDGGGLLTYGYFSGENITKITEGRPLFVRKPDSNFTLANFMRSHLYSSFGAMKIGLDILHEEGVHIDKIVGHGGLFRTPLVGQRILAAAMQAPVTVMDNASEGGAWGIALLANYLVHGTTQSLSDYLNTAVFKNQTGSTIAPVQEDVDGFATFVKRYKNGLAIEQAAVDCLE